MRRILLYKWLILGEFHYYLLLHNWGMLKSMFELTFVSICIREWLRNRATVRRILWCKWLGLGEFHYTLFLYNCIVTPAWINVWADLCFYSYRRMTKEPCYCEKNIIWYIWFWRGENFYMLSCMLSMLISPLILDQSFFVCVSTYAGEWLKNHGNTSMIHVLQCI